MTIQLRLLGSLLDEVHHDLGRPHAFAAERVGFLSCNVANLPNGGLLLFGQTWHVVDDQDYVDDPTVGAAIGPGAFRKVLQLGYHDPMALLHVHRHDHRGRPRFSRVDLDSMKRFVPSFFNACGNRPHGGLVLSEDSGAGLVWTRPQLTPRRIDKFHVIAAPLRRWEAG